MKPCPPPHFTLIHKVLGDFVQWTSTTDRPKPLKDYRAQALDFSLYPNLAHRTLPLYSSHTAASLKSTTTTAFPSDLMNLFSRHLVIFA